MESIQKRNYAIDWLRVWCMFFICIGHFSASVVNAKFLDAITIWGTGTVDLFVMITGYFGISQKKALAHFLTIYIEVIFYNVLGVLIFYSFGKACFFDLIKACFPFAPTKFSYWFVTKYLALLLVAPFIGRLLCCLNNRGGEFVMVYSFLPEHFSCLRISAGKSVWRTLDTVVVYLPLYYGTFDS